MCILFGEWVTTYEAPPNDETPPVTATATWLYSAQATGGATAGATTTGKATSS